MRVPLAPRASDRPDLVERIGYVRTIGARSSRSRLERLVSCLPPLSAALAFAGVLMLLAALCLALADDSAAVRVLLAVCGLFDLGG